MSIKISELPAATSVGDNDVLPIVQSGTTKKATASLVKTTISGAINSSSTNDTAAGSKAVYDYSAPKSHATSGTTYGVGTSSNYGHCKTINNLTSASYTAGYALSAYQGKILNDAKEEVSNKTNTIDENSTSTQYPNAEATYQALSAIEGNLSSQIITLQAENQLLKSQIPTYTANGNTINVKDSSNLPIKDFALLGNASQNGTPTPDSPVPIQVVTGDNTLCILGKNILDNTNLSYNYTNVTSSLNTLTTIDTGIRYYCNRTSGTPVVLFKSIDLTNYVGKTVKMKATFTGTGNYRLGLTNADASNRTSKATTSTSDTEISFVVPDNLGEQKYLSYSLSIINITSTSQTVDFTNLIITIDNDTTYKPYVSQTQLLSLGDIELVKAPDTNIRDRIYKSGDKWYEYHKLRKYTFTGEESFVESLYGTNSWSMRNVLSTTFDTSKVQIICNAFKGVSNDNRSSEEYTNKIFFGNATTVYFRDTDFTTEAQIQQAVAGKVCYYVLPTPTTTEITDTTLIQQLENVLAMSTYKNETNGFWGITAGNEEGEMQVEYYQDIGTLINDLRTAILSLGNNV